MSLNCNPRGGFTHRGNDFCIAEVIFILHFNMLSQKKGSLARQGAKASGPVVTDVPPPSKNPRNKRKRVLASRGKREFAKYLEKVAEQFLLPGDFWGGSPVISPASFPSQLCVRHIHKELDIDSLSQPTGFRAVMRPDLFAPGYISSAVTLFVPAAGPGPIDMIGQMGSLSEGGDVDEGFARVSDNTDVSIVSELVPIGDSLAVQHHGLNITTGAGIPTIALDVVKRSLSPANLNIWTKAALGPWILVATLPLITARTVALVANLVAAANAIAFSVFGATDVFSAKFSMGVTSAQVQSAGIASYAPAFDAFVLDNNVTVGRVISMRILVQNTSADLANGGTINSGRVPYDFQPFGPNSVSDLSDLPQNRRYQGKAALGTNVTWMPAQYDEFEPDFISNKSENLASAEYLYVEVDGWGGGALVSSCKVHFDWIVEFYTPNQIFEKILTPPRTADFDKLFHVLLNMPAATCNPDHLKSLGDFLSKAGEYAKRGLDFYEDHEDTIQSVLGILSRAL